MSLKYYEGNMFVLPKETVLVNPVNTVGVMGGGLAKQFALRYPLMNTRYKSMCQNKTFSIGSLFYWSSKSNKILGRRKHDVINFPTKKHWLNPSKLSYIETGLVRFKQMYSDIRDVYSKTSFAFPLLGCGLGGLKWAAEVKPLFLEYLDPLTDIQIAVVLYKYSALPECVLVDEF